MPRAVSRINGTVNGKFDFDNHPPVVVVIGSREFPHKGWVTTFLSKLKKGTFILSGEAKEGVDAWVKEYCEEHKNPRDPKYLDYKGIKVADKEWELLGRPAGPIRNDVLMYQVYQYTLRGIDVIIVAFTTVNEKGLYTSGTTDAILAARKYALPVMIYTTGETP